MAQNRVQDGLASCSGCDARWGGYNRCHCGRCHRTFNGLGMFDGHQRGGACLDPATEPIGGVTLRLIDGIWRGPEWDAAALREAS